MTSTKPFEETFLDYLLEDRSEEAETVTGVDWEAEVIVEHEGSGSPLWSVWITFRRSDEDWNTDPVDEVTFGNLPTRVGAIEIAKTALRAWNPPISDGPTIEDAQWTEIGLTVPAADAVWVAQCMFVNEDVYSFVEGDGEFDAKLFAVDGVDVLFLRSPKEES